MQIENIARQFGVKEIYVFGSRAKEILAVVRGEPCPAAFPRSDVDVGVQPEYGKKLSARDKVQLTIALEDCLGVEHVDLVVIPEADPFLAVEVIRGELLYCRDLDDQAENELTILRRAGDLAYYKKKRIENILA